MINLTKYTLRIKIFTLSYKEFKKKTIGRFFLKTTLNPVRAYLNVLSYNVISFNNFKLKNSMKNFINKSNRGFIYMFCINTTYYYLN